MGRPVVLREPSENPGDVPVELEIGSFLVVG